jgi:hypothetical protein
MSKIQAGNTLLSQYVPPFVIDGKLRNDDIFIWNQGLKALVNINVEKFIEEKEQVSIENIIYVSKGGNNKNSGTSLNLSLQTIKAALLVAAERQTATLVSVYPGIYIEPGDLEIPPNCAVVSVGGQYATEVIASSTARTQFKNMFLMNSGSYLQGFTFRNQEVDSFDDPSGGFAVAFAPGARIIRSPYIRDISQVSNYEAMQIAAPLDPANANPLVGRGGGTLLADRSILNPNSIFPYMLAFGATPRSPNGIGYVAKNGAGINGISSISVFQRTAFYALNGGQVTLNNSGTQFGDISMRATGSIPVVRPAQTTVPLVSDEQAAELIKRSDLIDDTWNDLVDNGPPPDPDDPSIPWTSQQEELTKRDAANLIMALSLDVRGGTQMVTQSFAQGFFAFDGTRVFPVSQLPAFIHTYEYIKSRLLQILGIGTPVGNMVVGLIDLVSETITNPDLIQFGSLVESLGHQFNNAGAGVNKNALPINFRRPGQNRPVPFSVLQESGGRVRWSGADELNNQYFAGGTTINGITGRFEGRPFDTAVRQIARRLANSRGGF